MDGWAIDETKAAAYETRGDAARVECLQRDLRLYLEYYRGGSIGLAKSQLRDVLVHRDPGDPHWT